MAKYFPVFKFGGSSHPFSVVMPNGEKRKFSYCRMQAHSNIPDEVALVLEQETPKRFNVVSYDNPKMAEQAKQLNVVDVMPANVMPTPVKEVKKEIKPIVKKEVPKLDKHEIEFTKQELESKSKQMGFKKFRNWAKKKFGTTDRSLKVLIKEVLKIQNKR